MFMTVHSTTAPPLEWGQGSDGTCKAMWFAVAWWWKTMSDHMHQLT